MRAKLQANGRGGPMTQWTKANDAFHTIVQRAAGNLRLHETISALHHTFPRSLTSLPLVTDTDLLDANCVEHREIRIALEAHDAEASRAAMRRHILHSGELVAAWFAEQAGDELREEAA
jgi:DNA-binding GntR family transcriptional regulator